MPTFMTFISRLFLLAAGLLFAAGLGLAAVVMLALLGVRAAWARLTGKPAMPFIIRHRRANSVRQRRPAADITDVEPRTPQA
jgi:polyferredoxin